MCLGSRKQGVHRNVERRHAARGLVQICRRPGIKGKLAVGKVVQVHNGRLEFRLGGCKRRLLRGSVSNRIVCRGALCRCGEKRRRLGRIAGRAGCRGGFTRCLHDGAGGKVVRGHGCRRGRGKRCGLYTCRASSAAHEFFGGPGAVAHHVVEAQRKKAVFALVKRVFRMPSGRLGTPAAVAQCVARPHLVPSSRTVYLIDYMELALRPTLGFVHSRTRAQKGRGAGALPTYRRQPPWPR